MLMSFKWEEILMKDSNELLAQCWRVRPDLGQILPERTGMGQATVVPKGFEARLPRLRRASQKQTL